MFLWLAVLTSEFVLRLTEEVFDAAAEAKPSAALVGACVARGASTPSYRLDYADGSSVCVTRPWRVSTWIVEDDDSCVCLI